MVRVWNDNSKLYTEKYKDEEVKIAPKAFVVMEESDAVAFLGQYTSIKKDGQGNALNPKMLRLERADNALDGYTPYAAPKCMACRKEFQTEEELKDHSLKFHESILADEEIKKELRKKAS